MKYEIYCDESQPDVFWSESEKKAKFLVIGGLWLPSELRQELKAGIGELKTKHGFKHEIKWRKAHSKNEAFYIDLIDFFMGYGDQLRFRAIIVEADKVNMVRFHQDDAELGFYKFYYQLIKNWIYSFNEYRVYCDDKTNREGGRLKVLGKTLDYADVSSKVEIVQALPSREVVLIQLTDLFVGIVSSRFNGTIQTGSTKDQIIKHMESRLGIEKLAPTYRSEKKFNIFKINLDGGW